MYKYIHTCMYIHIYTSAHIHTYTYMHTHIQNVHMKRTQARLERRRGSERARSRCRPRTLCTSLSFDAINPHFAPPMQGLHCTHVLQHSYPSTPYPLFTTYPRTFRSLRSFTMAPCVVVERLEGKQRSRRAAVSEHAGIQARNWSSWPVHSQPMSLATEALPETRLHFCHFPAVF